MRWRPWRRREPRPVHDSTGFDEAHAALDEVLSRWPEVRETAEAMRTIRRENHLAEKAYQAMRERRA